MPNPDDEPDDLMESSLVWPDPSRPVVNQRPPAFPGWHPQQEDQGYQGYSGYQAMPPPGHRAAGRRRIVLLVAAALLVIAAGVVVALLVG